jgi:hypothetical protein
METPLQLGTIGAPVSSHLRWVIDDHIRKLERHYGRLTSLRLAIGASGAHHRIGKSLSVSIHIALPDRREVSVKPVSYDRDPRQAGIAFAVSDAFRCATAQLQRHAEALKETPRPRHGSKTGLKGPQARMVRLPNGAHFV